MKNTELAAHWQSLDLEGRKAWLSQLHNVNVVVTSEQIGVEVNELDAVAIQVGLIPVRVHAVDAAGMRELAYGVRGPLFSHGQFRQWQCLDPEENAVVSHVDAMQNPIFSRVARTLEHSIPDDTGFGRFRDGS